jgi:hypothetical protein
MNWNLSEIGINIGLMVGGFFGSLITIKKKRSIKEQLLSIITGTMSANYLTPVLIDWFSLQGSSQYGTAFIVGFGGLKLVEALYDKFFNKVGA